MSDRPKVEKAPAEGKLGEQAKLDDELEDTFPASDPPSQTDPAKSEKRSE